VERFDEYLNALASSDPTPGGGSAAMLVAATGCALLAMVGRICAASQKSRAVHPLAQRVTEHADALRAGMLARRSRDELAFDAVMKAKGDPQEVQRTLFAAAQVPLEGAQDSLELLKLTHEALLLGNKNVISDTGCAAEFAFAALLACAYNVRINHRFMHDTQTIALQRTALELCEREAARTIAEIRKAVGAALAPPGVSTI